MSEEVVARRMSLSSPGAEDSMEVSFPNGRHSLPRPSLLEVCRRAGAFYSIVKKGKGGRELTSTKITPSNSM